MTVSETIEKSQLPRINASLSVPLILIGAIIGILPMVVYVRIVHFDGLAGQIYGPSIQGDLFSYYKAIWLQILTFSGLLWFWCNRKVQENWYHRPIVVYCFLVVVSTVLAIHRELALWGDPHRHEGLMVHLSYMGVLFLFINLTDRLGILRLMSACFLVSATILSLVGLGQFMGVEFLRFPFANWLLIPDHVRSVLPEIDLSKLPNDGHFIFLTFGNGNFTGSYMAMPFAFSMAFVFLWRSRTKFLFLPLNILILINLLGTKSRAGQLGSLFAALIIFLFSRKRIRENWRLIGLFMFAIILSPFAMDAFTWSQPGMPRFLSSSINRPIESRSGLFGNFEDLKLEKDSASFVFDGVKTQVRRINEQIEFYDHNGEKVDYSLLPNPSLRVDAGKILASVSVCASESTVFAKSASANVTTVSQQIASGPASNTDGFFHSKEYLVVFPEKKLRGFLIYAWPDYNVLEIGRGGVSFYIAATQNGFKLINQFGKYEDVKEVESFGFKDSQGFASNRGYIWSRTIPLLRKALFVGFGPDTFAAHFPNNDYLGKLRVWSSGVFTMIEKPHCLYLQIAINSGLISLAAVLIMLAVYLHESARIYWHCSFENFSEVAGIGIMAAVLAYLVAAIFNDSIVGIAPVFWALLGMGIAANRLNLEAAKK